MLLIPVGGSQGMWAERHSGRHLVYGAGAGVGARSAGRLRPRSRRRGPRAGSAHGSYGAATEAAVGAFQRASGLPATGDGDVKTLQALASPDARRVIAPAVKTLDLVATAYGPSLRDNFPYGPVDLFGKPLQPGEVAVDPSVIPIGTHLWISGYQSAVLPAGGFAAVAADTGGAIQGNRVDIFLGCRTVRCLRVRRAARHRDRDAVTGWGRPSRPQSYSGVALEFPGLSRHPADGRESRHLRVIPAKYAV
jgi:3D (Asp-Asp-Asp) domain-containing protein